MGIATSALRISVGLGMMLLLVPRAGLGFDLVPLTFSPVSIEAIASFSGAVSAAQSSGELTTSAAITFAFSDVDHAGSIMASGSIEGNAIQFTSSISLTEVGPIQDTSDELLVTVRADVPYVGGPMTPIIGRLEDISGSVVGEFQFEGVFASTGFPSVTSTSLASEYSPANTGASVESPRAFVVSVLAGDSAELSFQIRASMNPLPDTSVQVDRSFTLRLYTVGQAPGSGDLNADGLTDILDSTLLRRVLAGF